MLYAIFQCVWFNFKFFTILQTAASLLATLEHCRMQILEDPSYDLPLEIKKLRQANFKNEYKQRQKR